MKTTGMRMTSTKTKDLKMTKTRRFEMQSAQYKAKGFTLITSLLLLILLSGFAIGLLMMVNTEQRAGGYDLNHNYTFHATEGAMEKMSNDLASLFRTMQAPNAAQICNLSNNYPTWDTTVTYPVYNVAPVSGCTGTPTTVWGPISAGPNQGLYAQIIPVTMNAEAQRPTGETVSMTRTAEVALIPVFQFGVFSDSDLFFGRSPNLGFAGRVHTNGDLYLGVADGANLVFGAQLAAFGNVIRQQMDNGVVASGNDDGGTVMIPTAANGCNTQMANVAAANPSATCVDISTTALGASLGSVTTGHGSAQNTGSWKTVSQGTYHSLLIDGNGQPNGTDGPNNTGATDLTLPFVQGSSSAAQVQIIRRPPAGELTTSVLGSARLANEAQIRVMLSDTEAGNHLSDWNGDATQDVYLSSLAPAGFNSIGTSAFSANGITVNGQAYVYYFGEAWCNGASTSIVPNTFNQCKNDSNFVIPSSYGQTAWASLGTTTTAYGGTEWPILGGWLMVEVKWASDGLWHGVTKEWLGYGFARGVSVPVQPGISAAGAACTPPANNNLSTVGCNFLSDHTNAILYLQQTADRNGDGAVTSAGDADGNNVNLNNGTSGVANKLGGADSQYNWYPINLYDTREGENNDTRSGTFPYTTSCPGNNCVNNTGAAGIPTGTSNGVMNVVELDEGNLRNWLLGKLAGSTGVNVDYQTQNGYILYFSDRRGENIAGATAAPLCTGCPALSNLGEYGFEDTVNYAAGSPFTPNNSLEPVNYNGISPEDVNGNNVLDTYGVKYVGDAFGPQTTVDTDTAAVKNPFLHRIPTFTIGRANRVTGARHALKLVDASLGSVPTMPPGNALNGCSQTAANPTGCGGFTVASENPVYIFGNYNTNCPAAVAGNFSPCTPNNLTYDATWSGGTEPNHSAASIIADAVTLLSNNWQDAGTLSSTNVPSLASGSLANPVMSPNGEQNPASYPGRIATTSYYRVAIAAGKTIAFNNTAQIPEFAFGMDGGVHNFLRFLEDWGGQDPGMGLGGNSAQQSLYYKGSIVSLYWDMYATGTFKCCNLVYSPPNRQYTFDSLFSVPTNLPPGTPMFRNVDNLSYRQNQVARTN
jgi:Tfp pilus assembly protein PilX